MSQVCEYLLLPDGDGFWIEGEPPLIPEEDWW